MRDAPDGVLVRDVHRGALPTHAADGRRGDLAVPTERLETPRLPLEKSVQARGNGEEKERKYQSPAGEIANVPLDTRVQHREIIISHLHGISASRARLFYFTVRRTSIQSVVVSGGMKGWAT